jgi:hypothetical protein
MHERGCDANIKIIWVNGVPYPDCTIHSNNDMNMMKLCSENRGNRNNYAIAATNEFFLNEFKNLNYSNSFQIIDAYNIILPRLFFGEYVCNNHYLCRERNIVQTTPGGLVVVMQFVEPFVIQYKVQSKKKNFW